MTTLHYQTLYDGTLLDVEVEDGVMTLRAGRSLDPRQRSEILKLSFADWFDLVRAGTDVFIAHAHDRRVVSHLHLAKRQSIVADARAAVAAGATHDCGEWFTEGVCDLCGAQES